MNTSFYLFTQVIDRFSLAGYEQQLPTTYRSIYTQYTIYKKNITEFSFDGNNLYIKGKSRDYLTITVQITRSSLEK